ncbi:hypothetical protein ABIF90_004138 [Bradyrhizobium japonicum]
MEDPFLNYFALGLLFFVVIVLVYGMIAIHDIPAKIAHARHHPHADAIHAAGWISLFLLHVLWPFLWIWAMMYKPDRGWGFAHQPASRPRRRRRWLSWRNSGVAWQRSRPSSRSEIEQLN